jgi:hypothetical protein
MIVVKYSFLFVWTLILLSMVIFVIRSHRFIRRKKEADLNGSEAIYILALLLAATLVLVPVLETLALDFDIAQKFYQNRILVTLINTGSLISLEGMAFFVLLFVAGRGLSTLIFFGRKPLVEFAANNLTYALLRAGLLLCLSLLLSPLCSTIYQLLLPAISTPFYR